MNKSRFVWHDLNTSDVEGAKRFYGEVFNWTFSGGKNPKDDYLHIQAGEQMVGGMRNKMKEEPTHWVGYVACDDVAATVAKISANGGKVWMPTTTMDKVGTFAVTADPTGGVFAPWRSEHPDDAEMSGKPGTFGWDELVSTDPDKAAAFYAKVFGWEPTKMDSRPGETYTLFNRPGTTGPGGMVRGAGGLMKAPPGVSHSFWIPYVFVENVDQMCEKATRLGGKVMVPPMDVPNIVRMACWSDPQGASIAVIKPLM